LLVTPCVHNTQCLLRLGILLWLQNSISVSYLLIISDTAQRGTMGVKRQQDLTSSCTVVLLGDARAGKTAMVNRLLTDKFSESYIKTSSSGEKSEWSLTVAGRNISYSIVDVGGSKTSAQASVSKSNLSLHNTSHNSNNGGGISLKSAGIFREADVFLLCYRISDPASLFSAINFWCPEIRCYAPTTPIILVGCQSDLRTDRDILATLARRGQAPVSTDQGLTLSQQTGCLLYIESSSRHSLKSVISAFEVAALAKFGHLSTTPRNISMSLMSLGGPRYMPPPVPPKPYVGGLQHPSFNRISPPVPPKPRRAMSTMALNHQPPMHNSMLEKENFNYVSQNHLDQSDSIIVHQDLHQQQHKSHLVIHRPSGSKSNLLSGSSPRLNFKTSKERSMSSLLSLNGPRTPKLSRRGGHGFGGNGNKNNEDKTVTIKCQRLNADKQYEEVDVEVPAPIYDTLRFYNSESSASSGLDTTSSRGSRQSDRGEFNVTNKNKTFTSKIKSLFGRTS